MVKLVIVEENEIVLLGLKAALEGYEDVKLLEVYARTEELFSNLERLKPDVILLGGNGTTQNCRKILGSLPETRVLPLSGEENDSELYELFLSGAAGLLPKDASKDEVATSVGIVAKGGLSLNRDILKRLLERLPQPLKDDEVEVFKTLTDREKTVLAMVAQGHRNEVIGSSLNISKSTVRNCISRLKSKLYVDSRAELMSAGMRLRFMGILNL